MNEQAATRFRLIPLAIAVACTALGLRAVDIYSGLNILVEPVIAQEAGNSDDAQPAEGSDETEAAEPAEETYIPPVVGLPDSAEMEIITQLRQRRELLEQRAQQLDLQEQLLSSTEKRIDDKIQQLRVLEQQIKGHLRLFEEREDGQLQAIVKVYETMKPKEAAPRFEVLALQTQLDLVTRMKSSKVAALMEKMTPAKASALTTELATRAQPPSIADLDGR
ncbi:MAG: MotE family protein [Kordiimonas sp.]